MYKIIDLGVEVPETGEARVRLIHESLIKTASSEIQNFWDSIERSDDYAYLWVIGVSAKEYYGCNNNGDAFTEEDLKKTHQDFVSSANVFLQHVNKDPAKGIGKPVFSWYNDAMHRVELILRIEKGRLNAAETVRKISAGEPIYVSMGCTVAYDVCSICGNQAPTRRQYCDHLRYNMKKILPDGRQVYADNPNPKFFDISIVAKPADPTAHTLDKMASEGRYVMPAKTAAELGEEAEDISLKLAALKKVSDIIKQVEGRVVDAKEGTPEVAAATAIANQGFKDFPYPDMPYEQLSGMGVSPAGFISSMSSMGAPITLGDAAWMAGSGVLGRCPSSDEFSQIFAMLPRVIPQLISRPELIDGMVRNVCSVYGGECDQPLHRSLIIRVMKPVAQMRITMISGMASPDTLQKLGAAFGGPQEPTEFHYGRNIREQMRSYFSPRSENFAQITIRDQHGREAVTTPYHLRQAAVPNAIPGTIKGVALAALATAALSSVIADPSLKAKAVAAVVAALSSRAAYRHFTQDDEIKGTTSECGEVPMSTMIGAWKQQIKEGSVKQAAPRIGTIAGMALPGALALDYAYNKWKYGPYAGEGLSRTGKALHRAGEFAQEHPLTTTLAGGVIGSQIGPLVKKS